MSISSPTGGNRKGRRGGPARQPRSGVEEQPSPVVESDGGGGADDPVAEPTGESVEGGESIEGGELEGGEFDRDESDEELAQDLEEDQLERMSVKVRDTEPGPHPGAVSRLYQGETSFDFVGRRRWWFVISAVVIVAGVFSLGFRGLNLGIDFKGGTAWIVKSNTLTQANAEKIVTAAGLTSPVVEILGHAGTHTVEVQADLNNLSTTQREAISTKVEDALAKAAHVPTNQVSVTHVGPTWGGQVTQRALIALLVFFVVVAAYISFRFEPKMAVAAFVALLHDLLVTAGVYSLAGFQVTPDTVIAVLTILGYSLYDTVVVFDRVRDNTRGFGASGRMTYSEMINLSMNQTLARSINTSLVAILPVLSVLLVGAELLGATTLQNYGLALTVGLLSGAYSSIFIASPVLAILKEREPRYASIRQRLASRGDRVGLLTPSAAAALVGAGAGGGVAGRAGGSGGRAATLRPGGAVGGRAATQRPGSPARRAGGGGAGAGRSGPTGSGAGEPGEARPASGAGRTPPRPRKGGPKGRGGSKSRSKRRR
jgi:preprotein translocase subunit SecF